jgi:rhamnosyltransferase
MVEIVSKATHPFAIIIPTYNAARHFLALTAALASQTGLEREQVLIVDSSSTDNTVRLFEEWGARVVIIPQAEFDHGGTRRFATTLVPQVPFVIFMTQDAVPVGQNSLRQLMSAFTNEQVGMAYGCQLPRLQARAIERHARTMNYPEGRSEVRTFADRQWLGVKTTFCSDSFAAYRRSALDSIGGVPASAFFGEDQIMAGRLLMKNWHLAYCGNAKVIHSHDYSIKQDFKRYFDVGVFHARNKWLLKTFGKAEGEGLRFVRSELIYLWNNEKLSIPSAIIRTFAKYFGYRLGCTEKSLPPVIKKHLSMASYYWTRT